MERIILTEADADEFLESIGVTLYENSMTIGETEVSGVAGQAALQEHGIFLYEDSILIEGQQAEDYLQKKVEKYNKTISDEDTRSAKYSTALKFGNQERSNYNAMYNGPSSHDPKYNTARDIEEHRKKYFVAFRNPNNLTKSEKRYQDSKEYDRQVASTAQSIMDREVERRHGHPGGEVDKEVAMDALRRKIRREVPKKKYLGKIKESYGVFEDIKFV